MGATSTARRPRGADSASDGPKTVSLYPVPPGEIAGDNRRSGNRRAGRSFWLSLGAAGLIAAAVGGAFSSSTAPAQPNVVVITIDTMRADAIAPGKGTPTLEQFLATATRFAGARTTVPLTLPAHVSLFSGLTPRHSRIHDNVGARIEHGQRPPLLAEEFAAAGYATAGFPAAPLLGPHTGIEAGFSTYDCPKDQSRERGDENYGDLPAEESSRRALEWLSRRPGGKPFFLWVHYYDPHDPYLPFEGDPRRPATTSENSAAERYAGEIRRVDAALEPLLAALPAGTIVVICSDHGEALGEHGEKTHGALCYSCTSDIFLAVRAPDLAPGTIDRAPRSICDIAPSLRAWCGLPKQTSDGGDLREPARGPVVTESLYFWRLHGWGQAFSVSDGRRTLVESGSEFEWFDRAQDPAEVRPMDPRGEPEYEPFDRLLSGYRSAPTGAAAAYSAGPSTPYGTLRRPDSRYLSRAENKRLPDPRTKFSFVARVDAARDRGIRAIRERDPSALLRAVDAMEKIVREDGTTAVPLYDLVYLLGKLGEASGDRGHHRRAAALAREVIQRGYAVAPALFDLCGQSLLGGSAEDLRLAVATLEGAAAAIDARVAGMIERVARELDARGDADHARRARALAKR